MGRTLLIGHPKVSWRDWIREHRENRDLIVLDPAEPAFGPAGRLTLFQGSRPVYQRFLGSLDPLRSPHVLLAVLPEMLSRADEQALVLLPPYRSTPLAWQTWNLLRAAIAPERSLAPVDLAEKWEAEPTELQAAHSPSVAQAQRKAQWLRVIEEGIEQEVDLRAVRIEGTRLGSGDPVARSVWEEYAVYAERTGNGLLIVSNEDPGELALGALLDETHTSRAFLTDPTKYEGLLCSFARANGEDFGFGFVRRIDWSSMRAQIHCTAVPPAPVRILRLGSLRVDPEGNEQGEVPPWSI